ncbi:MAG: homoserine kinase [Elusimicrobia bacterium]|nr:homoserine kinase [Elusimicrobiota bacterium]
MSPKAPQTWRAWARVPATTSNLGPGFDVLGMALTLYNELEIDFTVSGTVGGTCALRIEGEGAETLPKDETNEVARVLKAAGHLSSYNARVRLKNAIPVARGLGSSAAVRLGALLASSVFGDHDEEEIVAQACELEGHPDNVVPAFYGGLRLSLMDGERLVHVPLREPKDLAVVACVPAFELSTEKARAVLPDKVSRADAIFTSARVGLLAYAFERRQYHLLRTAMQDVLHQPYRRPLVPGLRHVIDGANAAGAFGAALSGAGPTVLALSPKAKAPRVARAMQKAFLSWRSESRGLVLGIDTKGAQAKRVE